ncbi:LPXTG cell wall anchor domain-containing protein [Dethiobacter alkaliphilus]|uniref:LPXTG cell wall anchor domain-containing protein n=1 Tax=Dethiobacter alkaliphilus TaxID=427926 RepID=UPI001375A938|nr:LPXTG cell wall anchor domain-containing protein [Dethiobacter alkaliphilus]
MAYGAYESRVEISGNDPGYLESYKVLKVDPPRDGEETINITIDEQQITGTIKFTFSEDGKYVDWETNPLPITHVFVKGGPGGFLYSYDGETSSDQGLRAPDNRGGNQADISHVTFYIMPQDVPDPAPVPVTVTVNKEVIDVGGDPVSDDDGTFTVLIGDDISEEITVALGAEFHLLPDTYDIEELFDAEKYEFVSFSDEVTEDSGEYTFTVDDASITITITNRLIAAENGNGDDDGEVADETPAGDDNGDDEDVGQLPDETPAGDDNGDDEGQLPDETPAGDDDDEDVGQLPDETPAGDDEELPVTSGTDFLMLGLGTAMTTGGLVLRRRKRK